ncbi:TetR/AcrR family transcriptional regulator [Eggerthellaceae bacterium 24-137]
MQTTRKNQRGIATREVLRSNDTAKRSAEIVVAARELYEEKGLAHTSIQDITNHVGVTRSLFYHYFQNKDEVTSAVLDQYITDFIEAMQHWHETQAAQETDESLHSMVKIMRMVLFEKNTFRMALSTQENAALYLDFLNRFAAQGAEFMVSHPLAQHTKYSEPSDHLYETFYVLIVGLVSYLRSHPDADDEVLIDIVSRMLRLEEAGDRVA